MIPQEAIKEGMILGFVKCLSMVSRDTSITDLIAKHDEIENLELNQVDQYVRDMRDDFDAEAAIIGLVDDDC